MGLGSFKMKEAKVKSLHRVQASNSLPPVDCNLSGSVTMGFSRQEYWRGLPFPSPGDLPHPRIKPRSPALQADSLTSELLGKLGGSDSNEG